MSVVQLGLSFRNVSNSIVPEGITAHYGGPSPWGKVSRDTAKAFETTTDHGRCGGIVRSWHNYHISKSWSGLAYTSVVCPHGVVFEGRGRGKRTAANGTNEGNKRSYAVCYLAGGNDPLTDSAKAAFHSEAKRLGVPLKWIHKQWKPTSCPGKALEAWALGGWKLNGHPVTIPNTPTSEDLDMDEDRLRAIVRSEVKRGTNETVEFLVTFITDNARSSFNKVAEWTKAMSDLTVKRIKG